jgi:Na+-transporting NADH:ubiquinone oxidoreductase subunit D
MAETQIAPQTESTSLFGAKERKLLVDPLNDDNPVTVQILGVCSALAVTSQVKPALIMALGLTIVTAMSNLVISMMRNSIPSAIRMIVQLLVVAALVQMVSDVLQAFIYDVYAELSVFIGLIITNCIVMGRLEAFAMANRPWQSFIDGIGNGLGYGVILLLMATIREILGKGTWFGITILSTESWYVPNNLMLLPCASLFLMGVIIWIQRGFNTKLIGKS